MMLIDNIIQCQEFLGEGARRRRTSLREDRTAPGMFRAYRGGFFGEEVKKTSVTESKPQYKKYRVSH
jgi:hypothetical protein